LNKAPHEYADATHHPHVTVAKRMIESGKATAESLVNHFINFVICEKENEKSIS